MPVTEQELKNQAYAHAAKAFPVSPTNSDVNPIVSDLLEWALRDVDEMTLEQCIEWQLESCNCAGLHAPEGLIYNQEIAEKFSDWWDSIDDALESYYDASGERYVPETCGQLVWFAVEWYAYEIANLLRSEFNLDKH